MGNSRSKKKQNISIEEQYQNFVPVRKPLSTSTSSPEIFTTPPAEEDAPEVPPARVESQTELNTRVEERLEVKASPTPEARPSPNNTRQRTVTGNVDYEKFRKEVQEENYNLLKEEFNNPNLFLTNNILMSVQFFQNFERDRHSLRNTKFDTEEEMNAKLAASGRKGLVHDSVYQKIQECVGYKSKDNPSVLEPLLPTEYHISYECVRTSRAEDLHDDESARHRTDETGSYHFCAEQSAKIGFRKLRCVNPTLANINERRSFSLEPESKPERPPPSPRPEPKPAPHLTVSNGRAAAKVSEKEEDEEDEDAFEDQLTGKEFMEKLKNRVEKSSPVLKARSSPPKSRKVLNYKPQEPLTPRSVKRPISESASGGEKSKEKDGNGDAQTYSLEEDAYGYIVSRPVNLSEVRLDFQPRRESLLPSKCFLKFQARPSTSDLLDPYSTEGSEAQTQLYFSSKQFMAFFASTFDELASSIGKRSLVGSARIQDPRIMCREDISSSSPLTKESRVDFIPSVEVGFWPEEASEFMGPSLLSRKRPILRHTPTGMKYQWPPKNVLAALQQTGFNLVPVGFVPSKAGAVQDKRAAEEKPLQWLVTFTKVEQLIQRTLNHPKLRCYLFALLLYKTFMSEEDSLNHTHIRYMFYYMIEEKPIGWVDERLGVNFLHYVNEMRSCLMKERFFHYFIAKQNMFAHIPTHKLRKAQERFTRMKENIVPHLMVAIKRLHYDDGFYPMPDMDRLYLILSTADPLRLIMNPEFLGKGEHSKDMDRAPKSNKSVDPSVERKRELRRRAAAAAAAERKLPNAEFEKETIPVNEPLTGLTDWDDSRRRLVLEFFIAHFVAMTRRSNEFRNYGQGLMYLMHADNLMRLLVECKYEGTRAHLELRDEIEQLKQVSHASAKDYWSIAWGWDEEQPQQPAQNGARAGTQAQVRFG